jgi:hypothetical protein
MEVPCYVNTKDSNGGVGRGGVGSSNGVLQKELAILKVSLYTIIISTTRCIMHYAAQ